MKNFIDDYLAHHGIKGQKWHVRRFQNSDGSLTEEGRARYGYNSNGEITSLKKGSRVASVSINNNSDTYKKQGRWMYTYDPKDTWDSKVYEGPFSYFKSRSTNFEYKIFKHEYEANKDLKMPTEKERIDEFKKVYQDAQRSFGPFKMNTVASELSRVRAFARERNMAQYNQDVQRLNMDNLKSDTDFKTAYRMFNLAMENSSAFSMTKEYSRRMAQKFDAMIDDNNKGIYNDAHNPIIIFNPDKVLNTVMPEPTWVAPKDIVGNLEDVQNELTKKGRVVAL